MSLKAVCREAFKVKELASGEVVIEGWANKAVLDRGMDIIKKEAWMLDNYKKNPIMLFNHDTEKIVGKITACEARDEGLYVKCKMSKSKDPMVQYVKDLVQEGILNSFSVGFNAMDEQKSMDGVNEITKAELYEVSIVSIPMNQDSTFSVTTKSFQNKTYQEARRQVLIEKGAEYASELQDKIAELSAMEGFDKSAFMKALCEKMGCSEEEMSAFMTGEKEPTDEQKGMINAACDEAMPKKEVPPVEEKPEENPEEKKATTSVVAIKIPKANVDNAEAAGTWAEENGWKGGMVEEEGDFYVAYQEDPEMFTDLQEVEVGEGVMSLVGFKKEEQKKEKQAGEGGGNISPVEAGPKLDDNAYLQQARQTNVLLAMLNDKFETMIMHMQAMVKPTPQQVEVEVEQEPADEGTAEELSKWAEDLDKRIKMLGQ